MNCQFIDDWRWLDLTKANVQRCLTALRGRNFAGGRMYGVNFAAPYPQASTDLTHTTWTGSDLTAATFTGAILDQADFSGAALTAAGLTHIQARGTVFAKAQLQADRVHGRPGASVDFAHLEDVSFEEADLSYASFAYATLTGPQVILSKATLTGSDWTNATLSGLAAKLAGLVAQGAIFTGANLSNTILKNTDLGYNVFRAAGTLTLVPATLERAYLCGTTLDATVLTCAKLAGSYIVSTRQQVPGPTGVQITCDPTTITTTPDGKLTPKTDGVDTQEIKCATTCPDGQPGPCETLARWQFRDTSPKLCCVRKEGDPPCPPTKRGGLPCATDCDCHSRACQNGTCADDAPLLEQLRRERTAPRP